MKKRSRSVVLFIHLNRLNKLFSTKVRIISEISKEYFKVVDFEDAAVADFTTFAGGK